MVLLSYILLALCLTVKAGVQLSPAVPDHCTVG